MTTNNYTANLQTLRTCSDRALSCIDLELDQKWPTIPFSYSIWLYYMYIFYKLKWHNYVIYRAAQY